MSALGDNPNKNSNERRTRRKRRRRKERPKGIPETMKTLPKEKNAVEEENDVAITAVLLLFMANLIIIHAHSIVLWKTKHRTTAFSTLEERFSLFTSF